MVSLLGRFLVAFTHGVPVGQKHPGSLLEGNPATEDDDESSGLGSGVEASEPLTNMWTMQDSDNGPLAEKFSQEERNAFRARLGIALTLFFVFWMVGSAIFAKTERWSFGSAVYFCFISFTTVGYGDLYPRTPAGRSIFVVWALLGVGTMTILISILAEAYSTQYKSVIKAKVFAETTTATVYEETALTSNSTRQHLFESRTVLNTGTDADFAPSPFSAGASFALATPRAGRSRKSTKGGSLPEFSLSSMEPANTSSGRTPEFPLRVLRHAEDLQALMNLERRAEREIEGSGHLAVLLARLEIEEEPPVVESPAVQNEVSPELQNEPSSTPKEQTELKEGAPEAPREPASEEIQAPEATEETPVITSSTNATSSLRRPQTRSQTGTVPKRRTRDDSDHIVETKKRAPRKKQKMSSAAAPAPPPPPNTNTVERELTFYHSSVPDNQPQSRLPRSRASLPTPIPNLTKKSRGRRVPTKDVGAPDPDQKDSRLYVCTVEGCGKCFHRGEHLKRHIRSIHTHEKPFKCTFPLCEKFFNRHDNLLQHLKVHRQIEPGDTANNNKSASAPADHQRSLSPASERSPSPPSLIPPPAAQSRTIYNAFPQPNTLPHGHQQRHL
ncbi:hypothetical protein NLJ89_g11408 [Agrocybe chaxingu]|uniref:C2H2-type domain-containing protein n=1 Tax=Agrocybe chaxingu TaxID=84603 RepID=A0A9W8JWU7_9AGAR|nr:hypothetical protein NLJ89_g11408 [Agrocybe chaxingu]